MMKNVSGIVAPNVDWIKVIEFVIRLIVLGYSRRQAVEKAAMKFSVSPKEVLKHLKM